MGRIRRYHEPGAAYYITSVTKGREEIFHNALACRFLITCLEYHKYIYSFRLYGFVIMPDHFHCVFQPGPDAAISKIIQHVKGNFARKYNLTRFSHFWG